MKVRISDSLALPADILTSTVGVLGIRGSGKTNTAGVIVEEATRLGIPSSIVDPTSAWWGIKSSADGKSPGFPFYVFGGEHGDVPLEPEAGEVMARFAVEQRHPMVIDLSLMTKGRQLHFMAAYAARLYHSNREPFLQVIDETARFCPQTIRGSDVDASKCLGAVEDLGALGRVRGLGLVIIGQRAAKINKDVLTQCHTLIVHQTNSPQDKKAVDDWIGEQYGKGPERDRFLADLPRLRQGEAFIWSPTFDVFAKVQIRARTTFDSSKTPEIGKRIAGPKVFASVDLAALSAELQSAKQRAEDNDPRNLKRRIAELERELAKRHAEPVDPKVVEKYVLQGRELEAARSVADHFQTIADKIARDFAEAFQPLVRDLAKASENIYAELRRATSEMDYQNVGGARGRGFRTITAGPAIPPAAPKTASASVNTPARRDDGAQLSKAERLILTALAQYPEGRTPTQVAILAGYASKGGGFRNALGSLNSKGYIERGALLRIVDAGLAALGKFDPLPVGDALLEYWLGQLSKAESLSLTAIANAYPKAISVDDVARAAGYEATGGGFRNALGKLRTLQLIEGKREVRASDALFG